MSELTPEPDQPGPVVKVARDLTAIEELAALLEQQAVHQANATVDGTALPGGLAMVALGPHAKPDQWAEQIAAAELRHYAQCPRTGHRTCTIAGAEHVEDQDDDWEPVLQTLLFWSEQWRTEHDADYPGRRPTIGSEAGFIRYLLGWAWDHEPQFADFAGDIRKARLRLENVLYAGTRVERTRVPCNNPACEKRPLLTRLYGRSAVEDRYRCLSCKKRYDQADYESAHAAQLRSQSAEKFLPLRDAIGTLTALGRGERTIRRWLAPYEKHVKDVCPTCERTWKPNRMTECPDCREAVQPVYERKPEAVVGGYCDLATRRSFVWWPDLWRLHQRKEPLSKRRSA